MNYYIADCHFGHKSILRFDRRPFADLHQMEDVMIMLWNATVRQEDTVYILGDFCWGKADEWLRIIRKLNGTKVLIEGNHDLSIYPDELKNQLAEITPFKEIVDNGKDNSNRKVLMSHYPMPFYKHSNNQKYFMLCGHVHNTHDERLVNEFIRITKETMVTSRNQTQERPIPCNMINCFCMFSDYIPLTLDDWIRIDAGRRAKLDRQSNPTNNTGFQLADS